MRALISAVVITGVVVGTGASVGAQQNVVFTAQLLASNEVPPTTNADQAGFGSAVIALSVTRDGSGMITSATADFDWGLARFPATDTVILSHVHQGAAGVNGPVVIDSGLTPASPVSLAGGDVVIARSFLPVDPSTASQLISNPAGFYFNVHTSINPAGAVRGQLKSSVAFPDVGFGVFSNAPSYVPGDPLQFKLFLGNVDGPVPADVFAGVGLTPQQNAVLCPGVGNQALVFLGPNNTASLECSANLATPGSRAIPLARNVTIPSLPFLEFTLFTASVPAGAPSGSYFDFFCVAAPGTFPTGPVKCESLPFTITTRP